MLRSHSSRGYAGPRAAHRIAGASLRPAGRRRRPPFRSRTASLPPGGARLPRCRTAWPGRGRNRQVPVRSSPVSGTPPAGRDPARPLPRPPGGTGRSCGRHGFRFRTATAAGAASVLRRRPSAGTGNAVRAPATGPLVLRRYRVCGNAFPTPPITVSAKPVPLSRGGIPPAGVHPPFLSPQLVSVPVKRNVFPERSTLTLTTPFPAWYPSSTEPTEGRAPPTDPYRSPPRHPSRRAAPPGKRRSGPGNVPGARAPARSARAPRRPPAGTAVSTGGPEGHVPLSARADSRRSGPHRRAAYSAPPAHSPGEEERGGIRNSSPCSHTPVRAHSGGRRGRRSRGPGGTGIAPRPERAAAGAGGGGSARVTATAQR